MFEGLQVRGGVSRSMHGGGCRQCILALASVLLLLLLVPRSVLGFVLFQVQCRFPVSSEACFLRKGIVVH